MAASAFSVFSGRMLDQGNPMRIDAKQKFWQAATSLVCAVLLWKYGGGLGESEFSGGWLTGPLLRLFDTGTLLFILALPLVFFFRRIAAALAILASLLSFPFYLYFTIPGPFRRVFRGEYSVPLRAPFEWNNWAIAGILALAAAAYVGVRSFFVPVSAGLPNSTA